MNRNIKKQVWMSREEAEELAGKAAKACLTEAALIRQLIRGYEPREAPDAEFKKALNGLTAIGNTINQLVLRAHQYGFVDRPMLEKEIHKLNSLQLRIEEKYLMPVKSDKWQ